MRHKKLKFCAVLMLGLGLTGIQAQNMYVKESNGTQTVYALSSIQKMTFSSGNLTITETGSNSGVYALNALQYLNFTDLSTSIEVPEYAKNKQLYTYPNPVTDLLTIDLSDVKNANGTLTILNVEGRVMKTQTVSSSDIVLLDMSQLPNGIYFCQYKNETEIKTVKVIKL